MWLCRGACYGASAAVAPEELAALSEGGHRLALIICAITGDSVCLA